MSDDGTTRVPMITERSQVDPAHQHHFDSIEESRGSVRGPYSVLMNSPELAGRAAHLGSYVRFESTLSGSVRELAILTTVREFECPYPWAGHVSIARDEGVPDATIEVIADDSSVESLDELEQLVIQFGRQLLRDTRIDDTLFESVQEHLGTQGVVELAGTIGYYSTMSCVLNAVDFGDQAAPLTVD